MDSKEIIKWAFVFILGLIAGLLLGFGGIFGLGVIAVAAIAVAGYKYYKISKGEEIHPYKLMEQVKQFSIAAIVAVIIYTMRTGQILIGILICIAIALIALALIHAIRTDVLAMDN